MMQSNGIVASKGIVIGEAFLLPSWEWNFRDLTFGVSDIAEELLRVRESFLISKEELIQIKDDSKRLIGEKSSAIFDAHLAILEDPIFINEIESMIEQHHVAAEVAVKEVIERYVQLFQRMDNEYMKDRALDIKDVGNRIIKHFFEDDDSHIPKDHQFIIISREVTPSQLVRINPSHLLGIISIQGGIHSHVAIMARAMSIPYVQSVDTTWVKIAKNNDTVILDGVQGHVYLNPEVSLMKIYQSRIMEYKKATKRYDDIIDKPVQTADKHSIQLLANIHSIHDIPKVIQCGAAGVGLFRTEYIFMDRDKIPSEDEQFEIYKNAVLGLEGRPLVIRTLDIGGDKPLAYLSLPKEENPSLGYRAIRISLKQPELFMTQLKAILRASAFGPVQLMYPMITTLQEIQAANSLLDQAKQQLDISGVAFYKNIKVGITIEVPAAAIIAEFLAKEVDFISIGTNDLVQYVLAVDRMNENMTQMYNPFHPAILRLIKMITDATQLAKIPVYICGEMAGDTRAIPIWLGMGINQLSISIHHFLQIKHQIMHTHQAECKTWVKKLFEFKTSQEIQDALEIFYFKNNQEEMQ
jgi:phosphotransferase system enzyme I (PtsI)